MSETELMLKILDSVSRIKFYLAEKDGKYYAEVYDLKNKFFFKANVSYHGLLVEVSEELDG